MNMPHMSFLASSAILCTYGTAPRKALRKIHLRLLENSCIISFIIQYMILFSVTVDQNQKATQRHRQKHKKYRKLCFYHPSKSISNVMCSPSHIISHITDFALQNHLNSHEQGIAHVICKSQIVAPDANRCTEAKCQRALAKASIRL